MRFALRCLRHDIGKCCAVEHEALLERQRSEASAVQSSGLLGRRAGLALA